MPHRVAVLLLASLLPACGGPGAEVRPAARLATVETLADHQLGAVRGGFSLSDGTELRFAFQTATYVNGALVQRVVLPMVTVAGAGGGATAMVSPNTAPVPLPLPLLNGEPATNLSLATQVGTGVPAATLVVPGLGGATSVLPMLGQSGLTTLVSNNASGQLIQQATRVDIALNGLRGLMGGAGVQPFLPLRQAGGALPR